MSVEGGNGVSERWEDWRQGSVVVIDAEVVAHARGAAIQIQIKLITQLRKIVAIPFALRHAASVFPPLPLGVCRMSVQSFLPSPIKSNVKIINNLAGKGQHQSTHSRLEFSNVHRGLRTIIRRP